MRSLKGSILGHCRCNGIQSTPKANKIGIKRDTCFKIRRLVRDNCVLCIKSELELKSKNKNFKL